MPAGNMSIAEVMHHTIIETPIDSESPTTTITDRVIGVSVSIFFSFIGALMFGVSISSSDGSGDFVVERVSGSLAGLVILVSGIFFALKFGTLK